MGISAFDGQVVAKCRELGLTFNPIEIDSSDAKLLKCELPAFNPDWPDDVDHLFFGLMDAQIRHFGNETTLWIDCVGLRIPTFLPKAIGRVTLIAMSIVVTHGESCSLSKPSQLHHELQLAIDNVIQGQKVWHPIKAELVRSEAP